MRRPRARAAVLVVAAVIAVGLAATAVAFWGGAVGGSVQTEIADPRPLVLGPGSPSAQLYPGGAASVAVIAANPNAYSVHVGSMTLDTSAGTGGFDVDPEHGGCDVSALGFAPQDHGGIGWSVPPRSGGIDGALPIDMTGALTMGADAANACQGAVFTVHLVAGE